MRGAGRNTARAFVAFTLALRACLTLVLHRASSLEADLDRVHGHLVYVRVRTVRALTSAAKETVTPMLVWTVRVVACAAKETVTPTFGLTGRRTAFTFAL